MQSSRKLMANLTTRDSITKQMGPETPRSPTVVVMPRDLVWGGNQNRVVVTSGKRAVLRDFVPPPILPFSPLPSRDAVLPTPTRTVTILRNHVQRTVVVTRAVAPQITGKKRGNRGGKRVNRAQRNEGPSAELHRLVEQVAASDSRTEEVHSYTADPVMRSAEQRRTYHEDDFEYDLDWLPEMIENLLRD
jgi:hypothetical protein